MHRRWLSTFLRQGLRTARLTRESIRLIFLVVARAPKYRTEQTENVIHSNNHSIRQGHTNNDHLISESLVINQRAHQLDFPKLLNTPQISRELGHRRLV